MKQNKNISPVAVIGLGCLFPKAPGVKEYWKLLSHGEDAIREVPESHWTAKDFFNENPKTQDYTYCTRGGYLSPVSFNPAEFGIPPNILEATDTSQLLSLVVAKMTLDDAGYGDNQELNREKISVMLGATGTQELVIPLGARLGHPKWRKALEDSGIPPEKSQEVMERISGSYVGWQENSFPGLLGNVISGRIANRFDFRGTNTVLDSACASSFSALNLAFMELQTGRSNMVLSGGVDALNDIFMHMCFAQTGVLSASGDSKPFSDTADGTVLGEGIGMVLLKRLEDAEKDGDKIYAVIKSVGASSDGKSLSIYAPSAKGQANAIQMAYTDADVNPSTVELVEAHGTGTKGDLVEFEGLSSVFTPSSEKNNWCALGSVKSMIGHTKAAAGVAGLIKGILALHHKVIPPTLKINKPDPKLDISNSPFYLSPKARPWLSKNSHPRRCGVTASGFGGSNFHVVLEEYIKEKKITAWDGSVEIVSFSAETSDKLKKELHSFNEKIENELSLEESGSDFSYQAMRSRNNFKSTHPHRLLVVINKTDTPKTIINNAIDALEASDGPFEEQNIFYGTESREKGKLAFIFPGQGSQYPGMGKDLVNVFPEARHILETANKVFDKPGTILSDTIFPLPSHIVDSKSCESRLRNTDNAQPAIGAISMAMNRVLSRFGLKPDSTCGHSFGELSALCSAGWIDEETFLSLAVARGRYMASCGNDAGTMLAVRAPVIELESVITNSGIDVVLANKNSYEQGVLSGSFAAIEEAEKFCKEKGYKTTKLPVAAAFHSKLVEAAAKPFHNELKNVNITPTNTPVLSNTTGNEYPTESQEDIKEILGKQLLNPVNFVSNIENLYHSGTKTFVEVGPKPVLTGLVKSILKDNECNVISMDASSGRKFGLMDLAKTLCNLASKGFPVDLTQWEDEICKPEKQMMSIPLSGANYRSEVKERPKTTFEIPKIQITTETPVPKPQKKVETTQMKKTTPHKKNISTSQESRVIMDTQTTNQPTVINDALKVVQEGLKSMQAIQAQTAQAHNRFLEAQTEAGKTLQAMMERTQQMANIACGGVTYIEPSQMQDNRPAPQSNSHIYEPLAPNPAPAPARKEVVVQQKETLAVAETVGVMDTVSEIAEPDIPNITPSPSGLGHKIEAMMLDVVSQLTGYPVEMLGLDMDIEADLGIDSIKRVEILSTFEEKMPDIPGISPEVMSTLKTLGEITAYLSKLTGEECTTSSLNEKPAGSTIETQSILLDVVSQLTGYPVEMLGLDMDLEADLGIDSIKRVEILSTFEENVSDLPAADPEIMSTLKTLGEISSYLETLSGGVPQTSPSLTATPPSIDASEITETLLEVVSQLTGYPVEMLGLEMDIEADLGIDSIKRVEILSTFEEKMPNLPSIDPEKMGTLKTLGQIADYLIELSPSGADSIIRTQTNFADTTVIEKNLLDVVSELTGYPVEMLGLDMDIEADLGIDSIKRVEIMSEFEERMPNLATVNPDVMGTLKTLGQIKQYIAESSATNQPVNNTEPESEEEISLLSARIDRQVVTFTDTPFTADTPVIIPSDRKIYITDDMTGLAPEIAKELHTHKIDAAVISVTDSTPAAGGLIILPDLKRKRNGAWNKKDEEFLLKAFTLSHKTAPDLCNSASNGGAIFATITKLDGKFGFNGGKLTAPVTGGLAGLSKTASLEWDTVNCKALDISPDCTENQPLAKRVVAELLNKGPVEIGLTSDARHIPVLESVDVDEGELNLSEKGVVVISGGAKGVTAAAAIAIAKKSKPTIVLLGRSSAPGPEPEWLAPLNNESEIKKALLEHEFKGRQVTPVQVDKSFKKYMGNREITQNIEKLIATGSNAIYYSVDVRDGEKINAVIDEIRKQHGPIQAVIHGAGVLEDRLIIDKTPEQFEKVYGTKVKGLELLLKATQKDNLKHLVLFSSVSARLGNTGQVDYSMANEVLNKIGRHYAAANPKCHVISMNWGPWDGGMVNPALKKEFARKNIELIPIKEGAECLVAEMTTPINSQIEVVIGATTAPSNRENKSMVSSDSEKAMQTDNLSLSFKKDVDTSSYPILDSHIINNKPVVPFALMTEWFGHGALHENPGFNLHGIDNMRVLKGIKIDSPPKTIRLMSGKASKNGSFFEVDVEIRNGHKGGVDVIHSKAKAILSDMIPNPPEFKIPESIIANKYNRSMEEAYDQILFHGPELMGIEEIQGCSPDGMVAKVSSAPPPSDWISEPLRTNWIADPLVLDSAYQMAILWCYEEKGVASLPSFSESYRQYTREFPQDGITAVMEVSEVSDHKMKSDFTFLNSSNEVVATISGYEAIMDDSLLSSFQKDENTSASKKAELFDREKLLAYAIGNPSEAFGSPYEIFDNERIIARLPGPPYFFMDRVINIDHKQWDLKPGGWIESEYDIPSDEWYFRANRTEAMPFCVLLEIALQPCGWLAAYVGSALRSDKQLKFRNLGGSAIQHREIKRDNKTLMMRTRLTKVAEAAGMIIEEFDMQVWQGGEIVYEGETNFGFFTNETMEQQVGIRNPENILYTPSPAETKRGASYTLPIEAPLTPDAPDSDPASRAAMPAKALLMIDQVDLYIPDGGPDGLGYILGSKDVDPDEWFFKAHFYQDPVCPGSLGVESFIQLIKFAALDRWNDLAETHTFECITGNEHSWIYRGQVIPRNKKVEVTAVITGIKEGKNPEITANGYLRVDGLLIYEMKNFGLKLTSSSN